MAVLSDPLEYDAPDGMPIRLAFGLLVPAQANEQHLKILAHLAALFSDDQLRKRLFSAGSNGEVYDLLTAWPD